MILVSQISVRRVALGDLEFELEQTRRVLERCLAGTIGIRANFHLAQCLAELPAHLVRIIELDEIDLAVPPAPTLAVQSGERILAIFDESAARLVRALDATDDERLLGHFVVRNGENVFFEGSRVDVLRRMGISHMIRDRAMLSSFTLRSAEPSPAPRGSLVH